MKNAKGKARASYRSIKLFMHIGSPIFTAVAAVAALVAVLMIIIIPIVFFVNVPPDQMLLPPYMNALKGGGVITEYGITVGGGVKFSVPADSVTTGDIKAVVYSFALLGAFVCLEVAAVSSFLAKLAKGLKEYGPFDVRNADTVNFIGITVITAEVLVGVVYRFLNYTMIKTFSAEAETVKYVFGVSVTPILLGVFILLVGFIYGYACITYQKESLEILPVVSDSSDDE